MLWDGVPAGAMGFCDSMKAAEKIALPYVRKQIKYRCDRSKETYGSLKYQLRQKHALFPLAITLLRQQSDLISLGYHFAMATK